MATDDPLRTIRLMWDPPEPSSDRPKRSLSLDAIVSAALRLADEKGIEALSMRKVAAALGSGTMSLYNYVASRDELIELMIDRAYGEMPAPGAELDWRSRVRVLVRGEWELFHRHPWILQTNLKRLAFGPNLMDHTERMFAALETLGLRGVRLVRSAHLIGSFVQGAASSAVQEARTAASTGESAEDYYVARMEFWQKYFNPERYPVHTRIWNDGGFDEELDEVDFGVERLLDAIELLVTRES